MDSTRKSKIFVIGSLVFIVIVIAISFLGFRQSNNVNEELIKKQITEHGGEYLSAAVVPKEESPFKKSGKGNTIYKVEYKKDGKILTAFYRSYNDLSIIREPEEWIFSP
ncbi:hypothetical protein [Brevibacillus daliensis]|uniref:hypothetical protein n=1 Tax=Brevibacillus daliensis TaxID=2892995 RepID=UPI001E41E14B|nr:hypothetical protein [Brevibacillus daliensis]